MQPKILVIRGGAIGDFLLTLPAIGLLREAFPTARLEILGYEHIVSLAVAGGYADGARSIEYAAMSGFFNPKATLDSELAEYFAGFQQIVSYLYDPDGFFSGNLRRCGVRQLIEASPKIDPEGDHAARQLARPLEQLALYLDRETGVSLRAASQETFAAEFLRESKPDHPLIAIHPGSGGERKNWPLDRWELLGRELLALPEPRTPRLLLVGGEADEKALRALKAAWSGSTLHPGQLLTAESLPLPQLAALLARARLFVGHDSGISHLAAATGARCLLLFGPTDPDIWAPPYERVSVLRSPDAHIGALELDMVRRTIGEMLTD